MDITEDTTAYKLTAELPGTTEKDIEGALRGDVRMLTLPKHTATAAPAKTIEVKAAHCRMPRPAGPRRLEGARAPPAQEALVSRR
jgi:hypothetical protein